MAWGKYQKVISGKDSELEFLRVYGSMERVKKHILREEQRCEIVEVRSCLSEMKILLWHCSYLDMALIRHRYMREAMT